MPRFRRIRRQLAAAVAVGVLLSGCSSDSADIALSDPEVFYWTDQPVEVRPPPEEWKAWSHVRLQGITGVQYDLRRTRGGTIVMGEYFPIGVIGLRDCIRDLLWRLDDGESLSPARFNHCQRVSTRSLTESDRRALQAGKSELSRAARAARTDIGTAEAHLEKALSVLEAVDYSLDDALIESHIKFHPERYQEPERFVGISEQSITIGGAPGTAIAFEVLSARGKLRRQGRWYYCLYDGHLFVFHYTGPKAGVAVFERIVKSVRFPEV